LHVADIEVKEVTSILLPVLETMTEIHIRLTMATLLTKSRTSYYTESKEYVANDYLSFEHCIYEMLTINSPDSGLFVKR
jgi:hypothetical protein